jgi:hypothetical protein
VAEKKRDGQVWVLDSETKGTGAEMVPLERLVREKRLQKRRGPVSAARKRSVSEPGADPRAGEPGESQGPRKFKLVNAIKQELVAEDIGAREILELIENVPSIADVHIYVWGPYEERWRPLSLEEQRAFWSRRSQSTQRSWDGRRQAGSSSEQDSDPGRALQTDREEARPGRSAHLMAPPRVRPRLGRAPRSRPGGNR